LADILIFKDSTRRSYWCQKPAREGRGQEIANVSHQVVSPAVPALLSVGFAPGMRPRAADLAALAEREGSFNVSHVPPESEGWLELLVNGLTFDLTGVAPGLPSEIPIIRHRFGVQDTQPVEMLALSPGPHIAAGRSLMPVIRAAATLGVTLCQLDGVKQVCWHAAQNAVAPKAFADSVAQWLDGAVFPYMSLTAVYRAEEGEMRSEGLKLFIGQELCLEGSGGPPAEDAKLASRLIHRLVSTGRLTSPVTWIVEGSGHVRLEPIGRGDIVRAWRQNA
jgi:hypothetical protein